MTAGSDIHFFYNGPMGGMLLPERIRDASEYVDAVSHGEGIPVMVCNGVVKKTTEIEELTKVTDAPKLPVIYIDD